MDRAFMILRKGLRNDPIIRPDRNRWPLATRRAFLASMGAGAFLAANRRGLASIGAVGRAAGGVGSGGTGFLPSGHWVAAKQAGILIYPQANASVNSWARHLNFYWDATYGSFDQPIPLGVAFGAYPVIWSIITAPAALGVRLGSPTWVANGTSYGGYGDLIVHPTGTVTNGTITIQGTFQDGAIVQASWNASTTSSTSVFIFANADTGGDTNNGDFGHPLQLGGTSNFEPVYTATSGGNSPYGTAAIILRGATNTYNVYQQLTEWGIGLYGGRNPVTIIGYPGETATINLNNAGQGAQGCAFNAAGNAQDFFFQNLTFTGGNAASVNETGFYFGALAARITGHNLSFPNVFPGTNPTSSGASEFTFDDPSSGFPTPLHTYIYLKGISETNRPSVGSNNTAILTIYKAQYGLVEFSSATGNAGDYGYRLKAAAIDWTVQTSISTGTCGWGFSTGDQTNNTMADRIEYRYNTGQNTSGSQFILGFNQLAMTSNGTHWAYRNSLDGAARGYFNSGTGPYVFERNAINFHGNAQAIMLPQWTGGILPTNVTNDGTQNGTESVSQAATGVLDTTTLLLTGAYANPPSGGGILGTYGAQISATP